MDTVLLELELELNEQLRTQVIMSVSLLVNTT